MTRLVLSIPNTVEEDGATKYVITVGREGHEDRSTVKKRYSELEILYQMVKKSESIPIGSEFPKKGLSLKLSPAKIEERRLMIEVYLQEMVGGMRLSKDKNTLDFIKDFLQIPNEAGTGSSSPLDGNNPLSNPLGSDENKNTSSTSPIRPVSTSPQRTTFFNKPVGSGVASTRGKPKKTYSQDGEGIREAVKNKDKYGVEILLQNDTDNSLPNYVDGHGDTMLHLACIFNENDIAMMLVEKGAPVDVKNAMNETALDVCQPALKKKILVRRKKLGL